MAIDPELTRSLSDILQKIAYYQAGGGRPQPGEQIGSFLSSLGSVPGGYAQGRDVAIKRAKDYLETAKLQRETTPSISVEQPLSQEEINAQNTDYQKRLADIQAKRQAFISQTPERQGMNEQQFSDIGLGAPEAPKSTRTTMLTPGEAKTAAETKMYQAHANYFNNPKMNDFAPIVADDSIEQLTGGKIKAGMPTNMGIVKQFASGERANTMTNLKKENQDINLGMRHDTQEAMIENQALNRVASIRGDTALAKIRQQRDASIQAADTMENIKNGTLVNSGAVWSDLLGQLWRARTGAAPTDQVMQHLDDMTAKGQFAEAYTFATGQAAGKTTEDILNNIDRFINTSGNKLDQMHDAYMRQHLIKPVGLDENRWQNIIQSGVGGMSFRDSKNKSQSTPQPQDQFQVGEIKTNSKGQKGKYMGNGKWLVVQ